MPINLSPCWRPLGASLTIPTIDVAMQLSVWMGEPGPRGFAVFIEFKCIVSFLDFMEYLNESRCTDAIYHLTAYPGLNVDFELGTITVGRRRQFFPRISSDFLFGSSP